MSSNQMLSAGPTEDPPKDLKRSGSWKKFKKQVKQTVQGFIGTTNDIEVASSSVQTVTQTTYSTEVEEDVEEFFPRKNPEDLFPPVEARGPSPLCASLSAAAVVDSDVPMIVVTEDTLPQRPQRRGTSLKAKSNRSTPIGGSARNSPQRSDPIPLHRNVGGGSASVLGATPPRHIRSGTPPGASFSNAPSNQVGIGRYMTGTPPGHQSAQSPMGATPPKLSMAPQSVVVQGQGGQGNTEELQKQMAVMKIKNAIHHMGNLTPEQQLQQQAVLQQQVKQAQAQQQRRVVPISHDDSELLTAPPSNLADRRHSDSAAAAKAAAAATIRAAMLAKQQKNPPRRQSGDTSLMPAPGSLTQRRKSTSEALSASTQPKQGKPVGRSSSMNRAGSMKKAQKAKPMIWEHFESLPNTNQTARCKVCKMNVSCKFNTGNFVRHLQLAHKDIYRQYQNKMENNWTRSMLERSLK